VLHKVSYHDILYTFISKLNSDFTLWKETVGSGEECIMCSYITCTLHRILLGWSNGRG
jgi:hypothetical protein